MKFVVLDKTCHKMFKRHGNGALQNSVTLYPAEYFEFASVVEAH